MLIDQLLISEEITVLDAMNQLEKTGRQILIIAPDLKLKGVVTDADIRRHIIHGGSLEDKISKVANYNPKYLGIAQKSEATEYMIKKSISAIPLLDNEGTIVEIAFYDESNVKVNNPLDIPVVIMAGGLGTRLYPYTKILPKPLIPVGEKPIVEHIIDHFAAFGCKTFNMIVNHKKHMIKAYFNELKKDYNVEFTDEEIFLGTGGGLSLLKGKINSEFFLTNCDVLIEADYNDIYKFHKQQGNLITVVCAFKHVTIPYGVFTLNEDGEIKDITEKPTMNFLTNTGMYLVDKRIIDELEENKKCGFPDIIEKYRNMGERVGVYPVSENRWMDMGQLEELEEMRRRLEEKGK
ncbi:MAG: NTP transferase domain-containing protein [Oscillospiraceae bacterium]|nr:NTP transferase domain-containing protein [Oscillospiraceae bacterium]